MDYLKVDNKPGQQKTNVESGALFETEPFYPPRTFHTSTFFRAFHAPVALPGVRPKQLIALLCYRHLREGQGPPFSTHRRCFWCVVQKNLALRPRPRPRCLDVSSQVTARTGANDKKTYLQKTRLPSTNQTLQRTSCATNTQPSSEIPRNVAKGRDVKSTVGDFLCHEATTNKIKNYFICFEVCVLLGFLRTPC